MKPLRKVKPNPADPDWTFPYAKRERMMAICNYFENIRFTRKLTQMGISKNTHALPRSLAKKLRKKTAWPSVPAQFRTKVDDWFHKKLAQIKAERGYLTPGKIRSLRMNAAYYGRHVLTGRRRANRGRYEMDKRLYLTFLEWEKSENMRQLPKTESRILEVA
jgi:hypothetical protein